MLRHGRPFAHLDAPTAQCLHGGKAGFVGDVIAHEDRYASRKRCLGHEIGNGLAFVDTTWLHFKDALTAQKLHAFHLLHGFCKGVMAQGLKMGCLAVVKGHAHPLLFYQQLRVARWLS